MFELRVNKKPRGSDVETDLLDNDKISTMPFPFTSQLFDSSERRRVHMLGFEEVNHQ